MPELRSYPPPKRKPSPADAPRPLVTLTRTQAACLQSDAPYRGFCGGIGSGKSFLGAYDLFRRAKRDRLYLVANPTYPSLRDTTMRAMRSLGRKIDRLAKWRAGNEPSAKIRTLDGGLADVIFRTAKDPEALRGPNLSGIWLDEASLMRAEVFDVAIGRLREGAEQGWLLATYTPKGRARWTYKEFQTGLPGTAFFHARTKDNPFLPVGYEPLLRRKYSARFAAQELEGETLDDGGSAVALDDYMACEAGGCWWPCFPPPAGTRVGDLFGGIDIGRTRDRTVFWTWELVGDILWTREVLTLANTPYDTQMAEFRRRLRCGRYVRVKIDKGLMGGPLAEALEREWPAVVDGEQFTAAYQGRLAEQMAVAFERRTVRVEEARDEVRDDFLQVDRPTVVNGASVVRTGRTDEGHGDRFWAAAAGLDAAMTTRVVRTGRPRGLPADAGSAPRQDVGPPAPRPTPGQRRGRPRGGLGQ